jgi:hypothetical protein
MARFAKIVSEDRRAKFRRESQFGVVLGAGSRL